MKLRITIVAAAIAYALAIAPATSLATFVTSEPEAAMKGSNVTFGTGGGAGVCSNPKGHRSNLKGEEAQGLVKEGTHETEGVEEPGPCSIPIGGIKAPVTVGKFVFHLISNPGETKALTGAIQTEFALKFSSCEIKVPSAGNQTLKNAASAANSGSDDIVTLHATGISVTANAACGEFGIKSEKEAKISGELTNLAQKVV